MQRKFGLFLEHTQATSKLSQLAIRDIDRTSINAMDINHIHCNYVNIAWNAMYHFSMLPLLLENLLISKLKATKKARKVLTLSLLCSS